MMCKKTMVLITICVLIFSQLNTKSFGYTSPQRNLVLGVVVEQVESYTQMAEKPLMQWARDMNIPMYFILHTDQVIDQETMVHLQEWFSEGERLVMHIDKAHTQENINKTMNYLIENGIILSGLFYGQSFIETYGQTGQIQMGLSSVENLNSMEVAELETSQSGDSFTNFENTARTIHLFGSEEEILRKVIDIETLTSNPFMTWIDLNRIEGSMVTDKYRVSFNQSKTVISGQRQNRLMQIDFEFMNLASQIIMILFTGVSMVFTSILIISRKQKRQRLFRT